MVTLIARICVLCAASALTQMMLPDDSIKGIVRCMCGLLLIHMTLSRINEIAGLLAAQKSLDGWMKCLME